MVIHDDREDARQRELGHQQRARRRARRRRGGARDDGHGARVYHLAASRVYAIDARCRAAASRVRRRASRGAGRSLLPLARVRRGSAAAVGARLRARRSRLRRRQPDLPSAARAIVSPLGRRSCRCARAARASTSARRVAAIAGRRRRARRACRGTARIAAPSARRVARSLLVAALPTRARRCVYEWTTGDMPAQLDPRARRRAARRRRARWSCVVARRERRRDKVN